MTRSTVCFRHSRIRSKENKRTKVQFFFRINPTVFSNKDFYKKSIAVAHRCIMLLEEETFPFLEGNANSSKEEQLKQYENLILKINYGLHFYDNGIITKPQLWNTNVAETLHCLAGCSDTAYEKQARQMVDQSRIRREFLLNNNKNDDKFTSISN